MNSFASLVNSPVTARLGLTIVHSLWQVLAIALLLSLFLPWAQRRGARVASGLCCLAMSLCLLIPIATFVSISVPQNGLRSNSSGNAVSFDFAMQPADPTGAENGLRFPMMAIPDEMMDGSDPGTRLGAAPFQVDPAAVERQSANPSDARQSGWKRLFLTWSPVISFVWIIGVLMLSVWNCAAWWSAQRLRVRGTIPVTARIEQTAARLAEQLGIRRAIRLFQSTIVQSPVVVGAWKPIILLPMSLVLELPPDQLEALIAHELAHILRRDYSINLLQTAIETLLFYHPAVWWISAQVRRERENCCDDIAIRLTHSRTTYVQALAAVVGASSVTALPAANGGHLLNRIRRVIGLSTPQAVHPSRWLVGMLMLFVGAFVLGVSMLSNSSTSMALAADNEEQVAPTGIEIEETEADQNADELDDRAVETSGLIRIRVLQPDEKPMEGAKIHASVWTDDESFKANQGYTTDADGIAIVKLPKLVQILRIWVRREEHCPLYIQWWPREQAEVNSIPEEYTVTMKKGTVIAGVVKDPEGNPIPNVHVQVMRNGGDEKLGERHGYDAWLASGDKPEEVDGPQITDATGRWELRNVSAKADVELFLTHPDFVGDKYWGGIQKEQQVTIDDFRKQTGTIVLKRGVAPKGRVTDTEGKPIEGAVVVWGDDPYFQQGSQETKTDADGYYRIPTLAPEKLRITVMAKDWMPDNRIVFLSPGMEPVNFELKPGKSLRFRLVNSTGEPVAGAYIGIERWRGSQALYNHKHPDVIDTLIPYKTDDNGLYEWNWAPADAVTFSIGKEGYANQTANVVADGNIHTVVLQSTSSIYGTIEDAKSGQPIEAAQIMPIDYFTDTFVGVERMNARPIKNSKFAFQLERTDLKQGIQIEAKGYRVFRTTKRYASGDPTDKLQVKLEPAAAYQGRVTTDAGKVVASARVWLATEYEHVSLQNVTNRRNSRDTYVVDANELGQFEIIAQIDRYALVVYSDEGFAEVHREADEQPGEIKLKPWAKVTGRLMQEGRPVPNYEITIQSISIVSPGTPNFSTYFPTRTDSEGRFEFDRVPPIACHLHPSLHFSVDSALTSSQSVPLDLKPGQTVDVQVGSRGIDVRGQLVVEDAPENFDYHFSLSYLVAKREGIPIPPFLSGKGFDWKQGWNATWRGSQEGIAYLNTLHQFFVKPSPGGTISISGVEPGEYDLAISLYGSTEGCLVYPIAQRVIPITVKPGMKKLDLGTLKIPMLPVPKVGDQAPALSIKDLAGQENDLEAFKGKWVLLDFWASWCSHCVPSLSEVEAIRQRHGVEVIGINLDAEQKNAESLIQSKSLKWYHLLLGDWSATDVPRRFGVSTLPTYLLIDPAGKLVVHSSSVEEVTKELEKQKK